MKKHTSWSKWTKGQKHETIEYYISHKENASIVCGKLGFKATLALKVWVKKDERWKS